MCIPVNTVYMSCRCMTVVVMFVISPFLGTCLCEILRHGAVHERLTLLARRLEFEKLHTHYILCIINNILRYGIYYGLAIVTWT